MKIQKMLISSLWSSFLLFIVVGFIRGPQSGYIFQTKSIAITNSAPNAAGWSKYEGNPIFTPGTTGSWDAGTISSTSVLKLNGKYMMWYTSRDKLIDGLNQIGYAVSNDGISWQRRSLPVLKPGPEGSWDFSSVSKPAVVFHDGIFKMWYSGYSSVTSEASIGYATSNDGITWTKFSDNPVLKGNFDNWEDGSVRYPSVLVQGTTFMMWYSAGAGVNLDDKREIGLATSTNGITWNKSDQNPVVKAGDPDTWDCNRLIDPSVLYNGNYYEMWYAASGSELRSIGYATSTDGVSWVKSTINPVLERSSGYCSEFDCDTVYSPSVIKEASEYKMWYVGGEMQYQADYAQVGLATKEIGKTNIYGKITDASGLGLANIVVSDGRGNTTSTNGNGEYTFVGESDGEITIEPSDQNYAFGPPSFKIILPTNETPLNFYAYPCIAPSRLNICNMKPGDIILMANPAEFHLYNPQMWMAIGGTYFNHAAMYLGIIPNPADQLKWQPRIVEAQGPIGDGTDDVWETDLISHEIWIGERAVDWSVVRPSATVEQKDAAIIYARNKAKEIGVTYWACEDHPLCLNALINGFIPLNLNYENKFYCSGLIWKSFKKAGVDISLKTGKAQIYTSGWILPDDLYFGSTEIMGKLGSRPWYIRIFSPAHLLLTDTEGRMTGHDPATGEALQQIPNTIYSGTDTQIETIYFNSMTSYEGWSLSVTGYADGNYELEIGAVKSLRPNMFISNTTVVGEVDNYMVQNWDKLYFPIITP